MRIEKDGSVFRIVLDSSPGESETRISYAVNSHGQMMRPRIEMSRRAIVSLFMETLRHVSAERMLECQNLHTGEYWEATMTNLMHLAQTLAVHHEALPEYQRLDTSRAASASMKALASAAKKKR